MTEGGDLEPEGSGGRQRQWTFLRVLAVVASITGTVAAAVVTVWAFLASPPGGNSTPVIPSTDTISQRPSPSPSGQSTLDDQFLQVDQCVRNLGDSDQPILKITDCVPGTQRVVGIVRQTFSEDPVVADREADAACEKQDASFTDYYFSEWKPEPDKTVVFCVRAV